METGFSASQTVFDSQRDDDRRRNRAGSEAVKRNGRNDNAGRKGETGGDTENARAVAATHKAAQQQKLLVISHNARSPDEYPLSFDDIELLFATDNFATLAQVSQHHPAVVVLDPGTTPHAADPSTELEIIGSILDQAPDTKIIVITAAGDRASATRAIGLGAYDYYQRPIERLSLEPLIRRAFDRYALEHESRSSQRGDDKDTFLSGISTRCPDMKQACHLVEKVAPTTATVLLLGESGTGKELLAQALHRLSPRKNAPFIAINCAAIPANLLESELFGHEKGAFTGATSRVAGKIECAHKGTLFLDEIGDLSMPLQAKLLRFLQERVIQRIGGHDEISIDVRIVCATHHQLIELIDERLFRDDLYYRISEISINIPALRHRRGDAILLAKEFLRESAQTHGKSIRGFSHQALKAIDMYDWPGNVRELKNRVNRAVIMAESKRIEANDLAIPTVQLTAPLINLRQSRDTAERETLTRAISMADGNMSRVAELLGTSRTTVYELVAKHGMK